jgi:hypothetical protein
MNRKFRAEIEDTFFLIDVIAKKEIDDAIAIFDSHERRQVADQCRQTLVREFHDKI